MRAERGGLVSGEELFTPPVMAGSANKRFRSVFLAMPSSAANAVRDAPAAWRRCSRIITGGDKSGIAVRRGGMRPSQTNFQARHKRQNGSNFSHSLLPSRLSCYQLALELGRDSHLDDHG
jgi:hypothetical protein